MMTFDSSAKASILIESLPWLKQFRGQIIVVKFGGNAMVDTALQRAFAEDMVYLHHVGVHPVVVHGGGPQISARLAERNIPSEFRGGLRVTTEPVMEVVREVLMGEVNRDIAALIDEHGADFASGGDAGEDAAVAARLSGESDGMLQARQRTALIDGEEVDIGLVGEVVAVNPEPVLAAIAAGRIPVISSIAPDADVPQRVLNVNADSAAAAIAVALKAAKLAILTDVAGLYRDWPNRDSLVSTIAAAELADLLPTLESGMIPKMNACLDAVRGGVTKAAIIDGRRPHSILLEIFTQSGIGTEVVAS